MSERSKVVVALDDSESALTALAWGCHYAELAHADVEAVHVWGYPVPGPRTGISEPYEAMQIEALETLRNQISRFSEQHRPAVGIHARVVEGSVVDELVDASHTAALVVVGRRSRHSLGPLALGSVSRGVAERAACPVVVVHPHDRT
jgi:nucleotide-binding universal stress UspA family protein